MFENRVMKRISRPKREKIIEGWIKLRFLKNFISPALHKIFLEQIKCDGMNGACRTQGSDEEFVPILSAN
jgi:hypothetical protein